MPEDYTNLKQQVETLQEMLEKMMSYTTMPKEVVAAMKIRLLKTTGKTIASITQFTGTGGGLPVPKLPDGFTKLEDGKNIPFYYD